MIVILDVFDFWHFVVTFKHGFFLLQGWFAGQSMTALKLIVHEYSTLSRFLITHSFSFCMLESSFALGPFSSAFSASSSSSSSSSSLSSESKIMDPLMLFGFKNYPPHGSIVLICWNVWLMSIFRCNLYIILIPTCCLKFVWKGLPQLWAKVIDLLLAGDENQNATFGQLGIDLAHFLVSLLDVIGWRFLVEVYEHIVLPGVYLSSRSAQELMKCKTKQWTGA